MSDYAWIIVKDHLSETDDIFASDVGCCGPNDITDSQVKALQSGKGRTFYMYDDDGECYYTGRMVCTAAAKGSELAEFGPLDDFGRPNAGCTQIKWHGNGGMS